MKYEYLVEQWANDAAWGDIESDLNGLGIVGWRMCGLFHDESTKQITVFLMREKVEDQSETKAVDFCCHGITKRSCLVCG